MRVFVEGQVEVAKGLARGEEHAGHMVTELRITRAPSMDAGYLGAEIGLLADGHVGAREWLL